MPEALAAVNQAPLAGLPNAERHAAFELLPRLRDSAVDLAGCERMA